MVTLEKKGVSWHLFRAPVYLYRWRLGWLFGHRCLLLAHIGRRSGLRRRHFVASHRFLDEEEAVRVVEGYEYRDRFIAPMVRRGFSWLLGWHYRGGEGDAGEARELVAACHKRGGRYARSGR